MSNRKKPGVLGIPIDPKSKEDRLLLKAIDALKEKWHLKTNTAVIRRAIMDMALLD